MIVLLSGAILALLLFLIPKIWNWGVSAVKSYFTKEPNKDSLFRLLKDVDDEIHIQFSNNGGKTYVDYRDDKTYSSEATAKAKMDEIISYLNKTEKILYEYDPHRLRITDDKEKCPKANKFTLCEDCSFYILSSYFLLVLVVFPLFLVLMTKLTAIWK